LKKVANPDAVFDCEPPDCVCVESNWVGKGQVIDSRQVFELPEPRLEVIEYRKIKRTCGCGRASCGEFPRQVSGQVQYGEKVQAIVSLLSVQGCLSHRKIGGLFADLYGYQLNEATIQEMLQRTSLVMPIEAIKAEVSRAEVLNVDETSLRESGIKKWLHTASTRVVELSIYPCQTRRRGNEG
jgi:transposase